MTYKFFQFLAYFKFISGSNDDILPLKSLSQLLFLFTIQLETKMPCSMKITLKKFPKENQNLTRKLQIDILIVNYIVSTNFENFNWDWFD